MNARHAMTGTIRNVRSRLKAQQALRGVAITVLVTAGLLICAALLAHRFSQRHTLLLIVRVVAVASIGATIWRFLIRPLRRKPSDSQIARLIEERYGLSDRLVTAVEFADETRNASSAVVDRLVKDASRRSATVDADRVVDIRWSWAYGSFIAFCLVVAGLLMYSGPTPLSAGFSDLLGSLGGGASANSMFINVAPGNALVPRGSDFKIKATLKGFDSEAAQFFFRKQGDSTWSANLMEPARNDGEFQYTIFNIQDAGSYYIEASSIRSPEFVLTVADLPFVKQMDLVLNFPAYTHLQPKKIENGGEIAALKGTVVRVIAHMTDQPKSAAIVFNDGTRSEMTAGPGNQYTGEFQVRAQGTYHIELISQDGRHYNGSNEYDIDVLEDRPPTVTIERPGRDLKVSSVRRSSPRSRLKMTMESRPWICTIR